MSQETQLRMEGTMLSKIALLGAGGKMGMRILDNLNDVSEYEVTCVEASDDRLEALLERGAKAAGQAEAAGDADVVIFAVPDRLMGTIAAEVVPTMRSGAMAIFLDAAAPYAGILPTRDDVTYIVTHPCHPSAFNWEPDPQAHRDHFGGISAHQDVICALMQVPESDYERGAAIIRGMFAPVVNVHRVTVEQAFLLEPVLAETTGATCIVIVKEAMDEAVRRGVPSEAARAFILGHLQIELAIVFGEIDSPFSDGAKRAIEEAKKALFRDDWKRIFEPEEMARSATSITGTAAS
jgi:D-apionate oxidoisomerase